MHGFTVLVFALVALNPWSVPGQSADPLAPIAWLAGCWSADGKDAGSGEHWLPAAGGTMFGIGRTVKNGRTVEHEFMQLRVNADGRLTFVATPSGQTETVFVASGGADGAVTFENLQHDFPQRVIYRPLAHGRMLARIEGLQAGALRGVDVPMTRMTCEAPRQ